MSTSHDLHFLSLPGLAEPIRKFLPQLLVGELVPFGVLRALVESYLKVIRDAARKGQPVNLALGEAISRSLVKFLATVDERMTESDRHILQAAVRYFVIENDAMGHDLAREDGLFDDARVVNAMLRWFGRDDLRVSVPEEAAARRPPPVMRSTMR